MGVKQKATVPSSSIGVDEGQSLTKKHNEIITNICKQNNLQATENMIKRQSDLETISMDELYGAVYPPKIPIVDGLIYNGTYLFVGAPKVGKSFFMAQLGYHVSKGLPLWGFPAQEGTVLYLALEDDYARLQKRLSRMFGVESTNNFYFATKSKSLNEGPSRKGEKVEKCADIRRVVFGTCKVSLTRCRRKFGSNRNRIDG